MLIDIVEILWTGLVICLAPSLFIIGVRDSKLIIHKGSPLFAAVVEIFGNCGILSFCIISFESVYKYIWNTDNKTHMTIPDKSFGVRFDAGLIAHFY